MTQRRIEVRLERGKDGGNVEKIEEGGSKGEDEQNRQREIGKGV